MSFEKHHRVERAYMRFVRDHDWLREELLSRLRQSDSPMRIDEPIVAYPPRLPMKRAMTAAVVGLAAMLLIYVGAARLLAPAGPAGGANLLSSQIRIVKSVCIPGWYDERQSREAD
ncbi:MAG: hypothetical protein ABSD28_07640 [Tepidisphaeraceae bacterium]|jgi:hypothetical protein